MAKPKPIICQLGNQEVCLERDSFLNVGNKIVIREVDFVSSTDSIDEGENSCASSGRNSPTQEITGKKYHHLKNFRHKIMEESGNSSGYESGYATPNPQAKKKRKLSKRKELLNSSFLERQTDDGDFARIHNTNLNSAYSDKSSDSTESSDIESPEVESTSSDEDSLSCNEDLSVREGDPTSDRALAQEIIRKLSEGQSGEVPITQLSDQEAISPGINQLESINARPGFAKSISISEGFKTGTPLVNEGKPENTLVEVDLRDSKPFRTKEFAEKRNAENGSSSVPAHKPIKTGKQRFRWNLLFNLLVWLIVPLPIWLPFVDQTVALYLIPGLQGLFVLMWVVIVSAATRNMIILYRHKDYNFKADYPEYTDVRHLVAISCYKEPVPLIARSVQSLADQTEAKRITMVISFEQKTPEVEKKIEELTKIFCNSFERLLFTIHPFGEPNEIPGKCSNANYGLRESVRVLQQEMGQFFDPTKIIVTTCDADSNFHPKYVEALTSRFLKEEKPDTVVFQAPLLYNWGLDGTSFVTRVTGLLRSTLMMGALIPFNINTMSIFSFSLKLCMNGNYVHPAYQMDDIICLIRWMGVTRQRLRVPMIPVPVISGPTSGNTIELELSEWARQARRWTIGAGEVFHYYVIKANGIPFLPAFSWGVCFLIYYGILLCSAGLYGVSASVSMAVLVSDVPDYITYTMYGMAGLQQLCFLVVFLLDVAGPKLMNVKEHISFVRNVLHWILTPFVLIGYSLVELYALHEVMIRGKEVCKHGASKKSALQAA